MVFFDMGVSEWMRVVLGWVGSLKGDEIEIEIKDWYRMMGLSSLSPLLIVLSKKKEKNSCMSLIARPIPVPRYQPPLHFPFHEVLDPSVMTSHRTIYISNLSSYLPIM
jgi:hypothetical protein